MGENAIYRLFLLSTGPRGGAVADAIKIRTGTDSRQILELFRTLPREIHAGTRSELRELETALQTLGAKTRVG